MILSELTNITSGINQKKDPQGSIFYILASDFDEQGLLVDELKPSVKDVPKLPRHYLEKGDVLVLSKGHHGFLSYVYHGEKSPAVASSIFMVLRNTVKQVLPEYLSWYINLESTQHYLISNSRGSALPAINKTILGELEIPTPCLQTQQKIVAISKLKNRESKLLEQLDALKNKALEIKLKELIIK